jgi:acyl-CoA thioester hydrolase
MDIQYASSHLALAHSRYHGSPLQTLTFNMSKSHEMRLSIKSYPHVVSIQTRYADIDPQMHVNSIRMGEIFEEARCRFVRSIGFAIALGIERRLVAALNHTYLNEALYPGDLEVANGITKIGRTSWTIGQAAFQDGRCVALCDITIVGASATGPVPLADTHRQLLQKHGVDGL